jgi:hypothetical protein
MSKIMLQPRTPLTHSDGMPDVGEGLKVGFLVEAIRNKLRNGCFSLAIHRFER